ncbi:hypothetical protein GCK72_001894 [Caenorhabditis remanei]|uniref:DUF7774 domain-containing protein n=1 Tax=Caenorhabditis remanei TaxID=31234 RepID=A0A6A5HTJ0_CAERE|nr:hypothetical protein GCK72_001894 [Caenorhabditis remanei]KAF1770076.1 hypothetical protein GCK72_001894 [Caenorhabditis remanei]
MQFFFLIKLHFRSGPKTNDSREELGSQTTATSPNLGSNNSISGNSRSKSITKRKVSYTREDGTGPKTMEEKINDPNLKSQEEKKEEKKENKEEKGGKKGSGGTGSKTEEVPSKPLKKKETKKEEQEASVFEEVQGPAAPAQTGTHGIKNKMRWKIDVEGADCNGDQKMTEVFDKLAKLRKKMKTKRCKVLKANDKVGTEDDDEKEVQDDVIINCARVLQLVKMEALISKEIPEADQEILRAFCRSGDQEDKAEGLIEKIVLAVLNAVVQKNEFVRQIVIPGELRLFAVDEKKAKYPMMALLMARKDLLYVAWSKPNREVENTLDGTWAGMAVKKGTTPAVQSTLLG